MNGTELVEYYNGVYASYPHKWENWWRDEEVCRTLAEYPMPKRLIDIGCGNGHTLELLKIYFPDTEFYGIDLSNKAVALAQRKNPDATFYCGNFETLELPHRFDRIVSLGVMEHMYDTHEALSLVKDYLEDGGLFYLEVPMNAKLGEEGWFGAYTGDQIEWHRKPETWEQFIQLAGFDIVENKVDEMGSAMCIWVLRAKSN